MAWLLVKTALVSNNANGSVRTGLNSAVSGQGRTLRDLFHAIQKSFAFGARARDNVARLAIANVSHSVYRNDGSNHQTVITDHDAC